MLSDVCSELKHGLMEIDDSPDDVERIVSEFREGVESYIEDAPLYDQKALNLLLAALDGYENGDVSLVALVFCAERVRKQYDGAPDDMVPFEEILEDVARTIAHEYRENYGEEEEDEEPRE